MKYTVIGVIACFIIIVISIFSPYLVKGERQRYHQHLEAKEKIECVHEANVLCTHLPIIEIETGGIEIPGKPIYAENGPRVGYTYADDGQSRITAYMEVNDSDINMNHCFDEPTLSTAVEIRVRGNSSRTFDKLGYSIKLVDENGENNPQPLIGMDKHHEWALHGPYLDKTLIRNYMWYNIAGEIMDYSPNVRFCEVIINGEYQGLYVLVESITAGNNGARLNLSVDKKHNHYTGYLLRLDRGSSNELSNISSFTYNAYRTTHILDIVYPGSKNLTEQLATAICQDFSDFEKALYSYDYNSSEFGYKNMIDMDSFVDYFLINEFTCNYDAGWLSTYIYKDLDGKFRMCIWDFNSACDNYQETQIDVQHFEMQDCLWYFMLTKDADFTDKLISKYRQLRETYFSEKYLNNYIDEVLDYLGEAIDRNYEKWGYSFGEDYDMLYPSERNSRSYDEAVTQLREFISARIIWMDENIETLRQFSAESKVKKFNANAN